MPQKTKNNSDQQNEEVEVLLIPKMVCDILPKYCSTISLNKDRAWEYRKVSLLYIKAKCNIKTMELTPVAGESLIWSDPIIRNCHPNPIIHLLWKLIKKIFNKNNVDAGSVKFELKRASGMTDNGSDWQTYISKVEDNFKRRTGKDFFSTDTLADEEGDMHQLYDDYLHEKTIVMKDDTVFATSHIVNLLSNIVWDTNTELPLLESMLLDRCGKKTLVKHSLGTKIREHVGQMKNDYPLANAQRDAVHSFYDLKDGEVLAVSGPPGTGKTTMLQSIVDEAGQVSPEIGLPTFALAKKAIVVGDVKQIPPVYSVPEVTDDDYWEKNIKRVATESQHNLLSCCKSSIMAIAEKRCPFERTTSQGDRKDGLFLNEHRRCVDEIIDYSNQLIYGGELTPKRGSSTDNCVNKNLPSMGIYVNESPSKTKDGSRFNKGEIEVIKDWIKANESAILEAYSTTKEPKKITDLINIITPFKAQSTLIHQDDYLRKFPAGTVHTFQGAESPIVIFSMVYGKNDNPVFIKSNHELMNVAVSRAKNHFIVVGSKACLERNKDDEACRLLDIKLKVINP